MAPLRDDAREWLAIDDPVEERTWMFDVTFLTSSWTCIYGRGCPGIEDEPDPTGAIGCCTHGAYLADEERAHIEARIAQMEPGEWQLADKAAEAGGPLFVDEDGNLRTIIVDGACVMQNRHDHPGGPGCALHGAALRRDESIHDWKPEVCWQAPLRREDLVDTSGHVWSTIRDWKRRDWGEGGLDFGWWCTEDDGAFVGTEPVWRSCEEDLRGLCGGEVYDELARQLTARGSRTLLADPIRRR